MTNKRFSVDFTLEIDPNEIEAFFELMFEQCDNLGAQIV